MIYFLLTVYMNDWSLLIVKGSVLQLYSERDDTIYKIQIEKREEWANHGHGFWLPLETWIFG